MPVNLRFQNVARPTVRKPARTAAIAALVYTIVSGIYIVVSGKWAASFANSPEQLQTIETYKGSAFVLFSGFLLFGMIFLLLESVRRKEKLIINQEQSLLQAERKDVAMMFAASIAHDINNYLMSLYGLIEGIREKAQGDEYLTTMLEALEKGNTKISRLAMHMTASAKREFLAKQDNVELHNIVPRMIALVRQHPSLRSSRIRCEEIPATTLRLNTFLLEEAVMNLLVNAGQATGPGGQIMIRCRFEHDDVIFEVHDNGPGLAPEEAQDIFHPGFTTKQDGTGLGLLAVKAFVGSCNGEVKIDRSELGGALFVIRIPKECRASNQASENTTSTLADTQR